MGIWNNFKVHIWLLDPHDNGITILIRKFTFCLGTFFLLTNIFLFISLSEAKNNSTHALTEIEQAKLKISHLKRELKEKEPLAAKAARDSTGLLSDLESSRIEVQKLQTILSRIDWDPSREEDLLSRKSSEESKIQELTDVCISFSIIFY